MPLPWWMKEQYTGEIPVPTQFETEAGPRGVALVRAWSDGKTDPGWGGDQFMVRYHKGQFASIPIVHGFVTERWNFAFVMRSLHLVCIDIDGKNGGLMHAGKLGMLPYTLAETSKSGDGYHLFYHTSEDMWDPNKGFAQFSDRIGLEQGVDLRATGCVFHHPQQRWNDREIAELPDHLKTRLLNHRQNAAAQADYINKTLETQDEQEIVVMQDALLDDLYKKPIPAGRRNTTLFAIGQQMMLAQISGWDKHVRDRAKQVGLDQGETDKLIANIKKYGGKP